MAKATHSGTCQICGCHQKLPNGKLSKHGYTTRWGFFEGVCDGAHHLPFEQSTDLIEDMIVMVKAKIASLQDFKARTLAMTDACMVQIKWHDRRMGKSHYRWVEAPIDTMSIGGWGVTELESSYTEEHYMHYSKETFKCAYIHTGRTQEDDYIQRPDLEELVKRANAEYVKAVTDRRLTEMADYITWQEKRVAEWVEQPLTPVTK